MTTKTLAAARADLDLWEGDVLLFRGAGPIAWLIRQAGGSQYSHAAMVGFVGDRAYCFETREFLGGRAVTLASQVALYPGRIDVYRVRKQFARGMRRAVEYMSEATGKPYGWRSVLWAAMRHLPFWRWRVEPETDDDTIDPRPPFCSQLVDQALRSVGLDAVRHKAGRITEPGDLARSVMLEYRYTLGGVR